MAFLIGFTCIAIAFMVAPGVLFMGIAAMKQAGIVLRLPKRRRPPIATEQVAHPSANLAGEGAPE